MLYIIKKLFLIQTIIMSDQNQNPTNNPAMDQTAEFVNNLVIAMLGVAISDIVEDKREEMVKKCLQMFNDFIVGYFQENFTPIDVTRLKAAQAYPENDMFGKFPDLAEKFEKAYQAFLKQVELSWQEEPEAPAAE
jgi:hypothetical protein